jgi:hypothetical protein
MFAKLCTLMLLTAGASACTVTESDDILTSGMHASISATADGTGDTRISASLFLGPPSNLNFVNLVGGDELIAHQGTQSKVMSEQIILNIVSHTATFPVDDEGTLFEVELRREVDDGAPSSTVALPAPFTLGNVPPSVSRNAAFGVNWTGPAGQGDRMKWTAEGPCIELASGTVAGDPGSVTMPVGTFRKQAGQNVPDMCEVKVTVTRERDGRVDPAYGKGGTSTGIQTRAVIFTSTP